MAVKIGNRGFTGRKDIPVVEEPEIDPEEKKKILEEFKPVFIPERRIPEFLKDYDCVVVNDFGDDYHMTEEERAKENKFYEVFKEYKTKTKKYRKIEDYVTVVRMALKVLDAVAEDNGVFTPEEFKKKFLKDKLYVTGLKIPKFVGKDKKRINWEYIADFILSGDPVETLLPKKEENVLSEDDVDRLSYEIFDDGEIEEILTPSENEEIEITEEHDIEDYDEMSSTSVFPLSRKEMKSIAKDFPELMYGIKEYKRDSKKINSLNRYVYDLSKDDFSELEKYDRTHQFMFRGDIPEFTGDLMNDDDYNKFMALMQEYEDTQIQELYNGKFMTKEKIEELEIKSTMERLGYNLRNLYDNKEKEKKLRKAQKRDKRREKELKERLIKVQSRNKRRMGEEEDAKKGKKKKNKKKKKDKDHHEDEVLIEDVENELKDASEEFLLAAMGRTTGDFKDYEEEVLNFNWGETKS